MVVALFYGGGGLIGMLSFKSRGNLGRNIILGDYKYSYYILEAPPRGPASHIPSSHTSFASVKNEAQGRTV